MTPKIFIIIMVILFFSFTLISVNAAYIECYCTFDNELVVAQSGNFANCLAICGKSIGGQTHCEEDCQNCCQEWCSRIEEDSSKENCKNSCEKTCQFKKTVFDIVSLLYITAGIVAAVMITLHGLRMIASKNPRMRETSKKGVMYVLFALILILLAGGVINFLMKGITKPTFEGKPVPQVKGCGGKILNTQYYKYGDKIKISVKFINNGDRRCYYLIVLYNEDGEEVARIPSGIGLNIPANPNEIKGREMSVSAGEIGRQYMVTLSGRTELSQLKKKDVWGPVQIYSTK